MLDGENSEGMGLVSGVGDASRCPRCGSTERGAYGRPQELEFGGYGPAGKVVSHVVWRRCRCLSCGQWRIDRHYENRKPQAATPAALDEAVEETQAAADQPASGRGRKRGAAMDFFAETSAMLATKSAAGVCVPADVEQTRKTSRDRRRVAYL